MESKFLRDLQTLLGTKFQTMNRAGVEEMVRHIAIIEQENSVLRAKLNAVHRGKHALNCTTCDLATFRKTNGGRRMLDQPGQCGVMIKLPHSFTDVMRKVPEPHYITKFTLRGCPYHSKVK